MIVEGVGGIVLCGGESKRMGRPKAWLPFGGGTMLQHIVRTVSSVVHPVVVVAAPDQELPSLSPEVEIVMDTMSGRGPLEGLSAGFEALLRRNIGAVFASSCDVPLLKPEVIRYLIDSMSGEEAAVVRDRDHCHPLSAVYQTSLVSRARNLLERNRASLHEFLKSCNCRYVQIDDLRGVDCDLRSFRNVNSPGDYEDVLGLERTKVDLKARLCRGRDNT